MGGTADELTEFEIIDVESVKGVPSGANGFPHLIMKGVAAKADDGDGKCKTCGGTGTIMDGHRDCPDCDGKAAGKSAAEIATAALAKAVTDGQVDEGPDVALGQQIMGLLARAIQNEAAEIEAGAYDETMDVRTLARAADMIASWTGREQGGCGCCPMCTGLGCGCCGWCPPDTGGMGVVMDSAAKAKLSSAAVNDLPDSAFAYIEDGGTKDADGKTTPRSKRHFPVHDKAHADNAAARIAQGAEFGDKALPKVKAAQKKFGESDAGKSAVAEGDTAMQTEVQEFIQAEIAKALQPHKERTDAQQAELAKAVAKADAAEALVKEWSVKPVHGGPVLSANARPQGMRGAETDDLAAKAALYRQKADQAVTPADREGYRLLAREYQEKADKPA